MVKKFSLLFLLVLSFITMPVSADAPITVTVDGVLVNFDQPPILENDRTLVPLRAIFEALGAKVDWIEETQTVLAKKRTNTISLTIGSDELYKNGTSTRLDVPAKVLNDRTLVPVRAVSEALDAQVTWDESLNRVVILSKQGQHRIRDYYLDCSVKSADGTVILTGSVAYPQFENPDGEGMAALNEMYRTSAEEYIAWLQNNTYQLAEEAYQNSKAGGIFLPYSFYKTFDVTYDHEDIISIVDYHSDFTGGAYTTETKLGATYQLSTGSLLSPYNILSGSEEEINQKVEAAFSALIDESPDAFVENAKEIVKENLSTMNFYLTSEGVTFFFQPDHIAPRAAGYPEISFPYTGNENAFQIHFPR